MVLLTYPDLCCLVFANKRDPGGASGYSAGSVPLRPHARRKVVAGGSEQESVYRLGEEEHLPRLGLAFGPFPLEGRARLLILVC